MISHGRQRAVAAFPCARAHIRYALLSLLLTGCGKDLGDGARETFAKKYSCPEDRIAVQERKDLNYAALVFREGEPVPSEGVRADPARLAKFHQDQADIRAQEMERLNALQYQLYQVEGCNEDLLLACRHPVHHEGGTLVNEVTCISVTAPSM